VDGVTATADISGGTLTYSSNGNADLEINWDGSADGAVSTTGLGGIDLTANGQDRFTINVLSNDSTGDFRLIVRAGGGSSEIVFNLPTTPDSVDLLYSNFVGTADFTSVDNIFFDLRIRDGAESFVLAFVQTTPVELMEFDVD
jgi:hypothetical protein